MKTKKYSVHGKQLTQTEVRVIILDLYCFARKEVAHILGCRPDTVKTHIQNIHRTLGFKGQRNLQRFGFENGFYNKGVFNNEYMFVGYQNLPWLKQPKESVFVDTELTTRDNLQGKT